MTSFGVFCRLLAFTFMWYLIILGYSTALTICAPLFGNLWETEDSQEITGGESYQEAKKTDNLPVCWDIQKKKRD